MSHAKPSEPATMVTDNYNTISVSLEILGSKFLMSTAQRCKNYREFKESLSQECLRANGKSEFKQTSNGVSYWAKDLDIKKLDELIARL